MDIPPQLKNPKVLAIAGGVGLATVMLIKHSAASSTATDSGTVTATTPYDPNATASDLYGSPVGVGFPDGSGGSTDTATTDTGSVLTSVDPTNQDPTDIGSLTPTAPMVVAPPAALAPAAAPAVATPPAAAPKTALAEWFRTGTGKVNFQNSQGNKTVATAIPKDVLADIDNTYAQVKKTGVGQPFAVNGNKYFMGKDGSFSRVA